jgi:hypothetical protein
MQRKVRRARSDPTVQDSLELGTTLKVLQWNSPCRRCQQKAAPAIGLDSQTLATLGPTGVDHSTTTTGFHANEKTVGTGTASFGRLVCAFHYGILGGLVSGLSLSS